MDTNVATGANTETDEIVEIEAAELELREDLQVAFSSLFSCCCPGYRCVQ